MRPIISLLAVLLLTSGCDGATEPDRERVELSAEEAMLFKGVEQQFSVTAYGSDGQPTQIALTWSSSDTIVATVDSTGTVRARTPGQAQITVSAGTKSDVLRLTVQDDITKPVVRSVTPPPPTVDVGAGGATLEFAVKAADSQSGIRVVNFSVSPPRPLEYQESCQARTPAAGSPADGTFRCSLQLSRYAAPGTWSFAVNVVDAAGNRLSTGGATFTVTGSLDDNTPPAVTSLGISPPVASAVISGRIEFPMRVGVADAQAGVQDLYITFANPNGELRYTCGNPAIFFVSGERNAGVLSCFVAVGSSEMRGTWTVQSIRVTDGRGNARIYSTADLRAAGFDPTFIVPA